MEGDVVAASLFADVVLTIIPSIELDPLHQEHVRQALENSGGTFLPLEGEDQHIADIFRLTHIISTHVDFPQYRACIEAGVQVVKPTWIAHSLSKGRQAPARQYSPDPSQIFNDVIFTCGDLPAGDIRAITAGVMVLGGQYSAPLTKLVTHIVTTSADNEKCVIAEDKGLSCKIVLPHWIDACLKLGKKISEKPYLLPHPEIFQADHGLSIRSAPTPHLDGAIMATPISFSLNSPPVSPSKSRKLLSALRGRKLYLSTDLEVSPHIDKTIRELIEFSGGVIVEDVDTADIYIGQYRAGKEYVAAARAEKEVANLSWLYHVINENRYTNPLSKMLHYPIPRDGIAGFENMKISVSNYSGDARTYVENLVRYCGAEFTKTMKQDNTHLITAHMQSEKCEAAQEWNIHIINHLWVEESYAKCAVQTLSNPKYTTFPARTNLGEVAGQTTLDMKSVERGFFSKPRSPQKPKSPGKHLKTVVAPNVIVPVPQPNEKDEEDTPVPAADEEDVSMPAADDDTDSLAADEPTSTTKARGRPRKSAGTPRVAEDKENQSPFVSSAGRASKTKALNNLHAQAGDIALFQKEMKRKGGVIHGGRRGSDASPAPTAKTSRKRTSEEFEGSGADEQLEDELQEATSKRVKQTKKAKPKASALPEVHTKMMVTGYDRWKDDKHTESTDRDKLRLLGVALTTDPTEVDILVAPRLLRTRKFVSALARAPLVVDTKYLDTALTKNKLTAEPAMLLDREGEDRAGFKLKDALRRAEENRGKLLRGWSIFVTKDVTGGFETYKEIINVNGGDAYLYQGRTGMVLPKRRLRDDPESGAESQNQGGDDEFDYVYLVSGSSDKETKDWKKFRDVARKQDLDARIVTTDWLLSAAMSQQVTFDEKWLL